MICSIVTPSAPAAPPLLFTFSHATQISRLGMSCDLPCNPGWLTRFLPLGLPPAPTRTAPPLRSPTHCDTQADHSYYGRVRQRPRIGTLLLADSAACRPPSRPSPTGRYRGTPSHVPYESLHRAHAAYMPDTTWAVSGYPPSSSRDSPPASVLMSSN